MVAMTKMWISAPVDRGRVQKWPIRVGIWFMATTVTLLAILKR